MPANEMIISERKAKLMIACKNGMRRTKIEMSSSVNIKGLEIKESNSERILGITLSNNLIWKHHFYGEPEKAKKDRHDGLLTDLSRRVGLFRKVAKYARGNTLRTMAAGIFCSKLSFSLPIVAEIWVKEAYKERTDSRLSTTSCTLSPGKDVPLLGDTYQVKRNFSGQKLPFVNRRKKNKDRTLDLLMPMPRIGMNI